MKKKLPLLPNVITAFGLSCGLFVIFKLTMTETGESDYQRQLMAVGILLLAAFADLLDGALARALDAESDFGGFFDSLADAISFGVAPSILVLKSVSIEADTSLSYLLTTGAMVYSVCGVLRLVRFNVKALRDRGDQIALAASKRHFTGCPIPAAAAAVVSANLLLISPEFTYFFPLNDQSRAYVMAVILVIIGYFMISRWKFLSLKAFHIRVASFQLVFLTAVSAVFIFYGILQHFAIVFFALSWLYILLAWTVSLVHLVTGEEGTATLEEFDPDATEDEFEE